MKFLLPCVLLLFTHPLFAQTDFSGDAALLAEKMSTQHILGGPIDLLRSRKIFDSFLEKIDSEKDYLTTEDLNPFRAFRAAMDKEFKGSQWIFIPAFAKSFERSLQRCLSIIDARKSAVVPAILKQAMVLSRDSSSRSQDEPALQRRWQRMMEFLVYEKIMEQAQMDSLTAPDDAYFKKMEAWAREKVVQSEIRKIRNLLNHPDGFENHIAAVLLNACAGAYDPHSSYFSSSEMEKFMNSFSAEGFGFGISIEEDENGKLVLGRVVPGSGAWRSGQLTPSDQIIEIKQGKKVIAASDITVQEAQNVLNAPGNEIEITVKKSNGSFKTAKVRKEKVQLEENVVRSYVLNDEKKIGYIALPGFYTANSDQTEGLRCANDVAKEIIKLKKENIEGLIFDLRNNGGGSLQEALSMAGIFIEEGPLGVVADKAGLARVIKDNNRGTVYDGPMIVLVNTFSASASEFLAAALQDYHRALIVGAVTYGKGTAQVVLPLAAETDRKKSSGLSKITVHKMYRITGQTVQEKGVVPDILLPDALAALQLREVNQPGHLPYDSLKKRIVFAALPPASLTPLKLKSEERVLASADFQFVEELTSWLRTHKSFEISSWQDFVKYTKETNARISRRTDTKSKLKVANNALDKNVLSADHYLEEVNRRTLRELGEDFYLSESYSIMKDYLQQLKMK